MRSHPRRVLHLIAAPLVALLLLAAGAVSAAQADESNDGDGWTFATANGRRLDVQNGNTGDGVFIVANNTPGHHQDWRLIPLGHGEFQVANNTTGKCLTETFPLTQRSCSNTGQEWHFRPVNGKPNTFTLVRRNNDRCLDIVQNAQYSDAWTQVHGCNGSTAQEWTVPAAKQPEAMKLATDYYAHRCSTDVSTCSWNQTSEGEPEVLPREKASSVWYNDTSEKVSQIFTTVYHSGWSQSFSTGLSTSLGVTTPVQTMISAQLSGTVTYQSDESEINGVVVVVPPQQYGWVDFAAVAKKITGTWTFDKGGFPWTTDGTVTVPVVDSPAGSTMYVAHTGPNPPGATPPAEGGSGGPQTFATNVTSTFDLPPGTDLAPHGDGVKLTDAEGRPILTMRPGKVTDTQGRTHEYDISVSGNTLTQTIEGASGETIEGTETMPVVTVGPGTFPTPGLRGSTAAALDDYPVEACDENDDGRCDEEEKKKYEEHLKEVDDWAKCTAQWTIGTAITGTAAGAILGPGAVAGGLAGLIGGGAAGIVVCSF
ncbi:RICIN domain-containing protein [Actinomadura sp. LOL_016]|uniref:RICIN domain-containing protein n=1 Tax=unclassified Actinomadura TaxID=2626254 RepID=UPI003A812C71